MKHSYAFTKAHYFKSKLDLLDSDSQEDKKQKEKLINQFKQFNLKYTEISSRLDIKNFISVNYIRDQLIKLNKTYPNFTAEQIEVIIDLEITNVILEAFEKKSIIPFDKITIMDCLFNQTCIELGWFVVNNK